jgi:hypothetical protein
MAHPTRYAARVYSMCRAPNGFVVTMFLPRLTPGVQVGNPTTFEELLRHWDVVDAVGNEQYVVEPRSDAVEAQIVNAIRKRCPDPKDMCVLPGCPHFERNPNARVKHDPE